MSSDERDLLSRWSSLPRRLYLDTGTLQTLYDHGGAIWEGEPFVPSKREAVVAGTAEEVYALRSIMAVSERAGFEFVVTGASLNEVERPGRRGYTQWVHDVLDTWLIQFEGQKLRPTHQQRPGNVSAKDWLLMRDALACDCDGFLTMERRLATQGSVIERMMGLRVLRPTAYWSLLAPWARLYH